MKIGIDIRAIGKKRTGDETYIKNLIKNLLKIDQKNQYFFYTDIDNENEIFKIKKEIDAGAQFQNYEIISITPAHKFLWTFFLLPKYLKKSPVDVLHVQYITPQFLPRRTKLLTTVHDVSFNVFPQYIKKSDLFFLKMLIPLSFRKADKIIAVSDFTKKEIIKFYKIEKSKVGVIYNGGIDEKFKSAKSEEKEEIVKKIKNKYNLPENFILYVGTLQPRKNIPFLLEGFKKLKEENKDNPKIENIKLVIGGSCEGYNYDYEIDKKMDEIKKVSKNIYEDIIFSGYIDDIDLLKIYKEADLFCFPSFYEGFGLPLIESMTVGTPVLCSDSSCHKEIATGGAEYFRENDFNDFTKKIFNIIISKNKREFLIEKGKERARFFSWEKCAQQTLKIYCQLNR